MLSDLMIAYLFLGGAGAGALFILLVLDLLTPQAARGGIAHRYHPQTAYRPLFATGYQLGAGALVLSAVCLLCDLGRPDRLLILFMRPSSSYLALGTYALLISITCAVALAIIWSLPLARLSRWLVRAIEGLGLLAALITMLYTGLLFQSIGMGTLLGTVLLPMVFVLSSLSTGIALLLLVALFSPGGKAFFATFKRLARLDVVLILLEALGLALLLLFALEGQQSRVATYALLSGEFALLFWCGVVGCGLIAPLMIEGVVWRAGARQQTTRSCQAVVSTYSTTVPVSLLLFIGGYCLRIGLLGAGLPVFSATTPLGVL
jgi:formate-dependent nitrite reductase membrane component NrfD